MVNKAYPPYRLGKLLGSIHELLTNDDLLALIRYFYASDIAIIVLEIANDLACWQLTLGITEPQVFTTYRYCPVFRDVIFGTKTNTIIAFDRA